MSFKRKPRKKPYPIETRGVVYFKTRTAGRNLTGEFLQIVGVGRLDYFVKPVMNMNSEAISVSQNNFVSMEDITFRKGAVIHTRVDLIIGDGYDIPKSIVAFAGDKLYVQEPFHNKEGFYVSKTKEPKYTFPILKTEIALAHPF